MEACSSGSRAPYVMAGALMGAAAAAAALLTYRAMQPTPAASAHHQPVASTSSAAPAASASAAAGGASVRRFQEDDILAEQFTRNVQFFGAEGQQRVADAFVIVVGLGGVGSHAAHLLLRSGVGRLRLIDFDQVTLSSLNRHAVATRADVGIPKATCLQRHFRDILPEAEVESCVAMFTEDNAAELLSGQPDFVLDAIDNIDTKVALLAACKQQGIPVLCVTGAGAKADPTRLRIVDVCESNADPLARAVRTRLRRQHGIQSGIPVLLSTERPRCQLVATDEMLSGNVLDYQIIPNFRVRTIPVLGTTPALFGMAAAGYILCELAAAPFEGEPIIRLTGQQYERAMSRLIDREEQNFGNTEGVPVDADDMIYLLREVWRGFSARSDRVVMPGGDRGLMRSTADLTFTRWDAAKPATADNLVLLTLQEADAHDALPAEASSSSVDPAGGSDDAACNGARGHGKGAALAALQEREPEFVAHVERILARVRHEYGGWRGDA